MTLRIKWNGLVLILNKNGYGNSTASPAIAQSIYDNKIIQNWTKSDLYKSVGENSFKSSVTYATF